MFELLSYPFAQLAILSVLVLAGIHAYLGYHVVNRGVIFVDLSLAQVSALGAVVAIVLGIEGGFLRYAISLAFTFAGALVISVARTRDDRVPQEAFIGIIYAAATATLVLLLSGHPEGTEVLQHIVSGSILTVSSSELVRVSILYAVLGALFYAYRGRFDLISTDRDTARSKGWNLIWWDFLFYAGLAVVVSVSVPIAGVLVVFSLLVVPPVTALLLVGKSRYQLPLGWTVAGVGSLIGILASIAMDLPTGPALITALVALMLVAGLAGRLRRSNH